MYKNVCNMNLISNIHIFDRQKWYRWCAVRYRWSGKLVKHVIVLSNLNSFGLRSTRVDDKYSRLASMNKLPDFNSNYECMRNAIVIDMIFI